MWNFTAAACCCCGSLAAAAADPTSAAYIMQKIGNINGLKESVENNK